MLEARAHLDQVPAEPRRFDGVGSTVSQAIALIERHLGVTSPAPPTVAPRDRASHVRRARELTILAAAPIRDRVPGPATGAVTVKTELLDVLARLTTFAASTDGSTPERRSPDYPQVDYDLSAAQTSLTYAAQDPTADLPRLERASLELAAASQELGRIWGTLSSRDYVVNTTIAPGRTELDHAIEALHAAARVLATPEPDPARVRGRDEVLAHVRQAIRTLEAKRSVPGR